MKESHLTCHTYIIQEDAAWEGAVLSRVAVQGPEDDSGSGGSGVNSTLAVSLSLSMLALVVVAGLVIKLVIRQVSLIGS